MYPKDTVPGRTRRKTGADGQTALSPVSWVGLPPSGVHKSIAEWLV
ncbi:MAG: hypothetical protein ACW99U_00935 [Candidatus Thorarchaeota archaeon]|jgi:hypothetical protein